MTFILAPNLRISPGCIPSKPIYRLLRNGQLLQARDQAYCPADDLWKRIPAGRVGRPYRSRMGPVRRFNK